jgi:hypothetical protein
MARAGWFNNYIDGVQMQKERIFMHPQTSLKLKPMQPHYDNRNETTGNMMTTTKKKFFFSVQSHRKRSYASTYTQTSSLAI